MRSKSIDPQTNRTRPVHASLNHGNKVESKLSKTILGEDTPKMVQAVAVWKVTKIQWASKSKQYIMSTIGEVDELDQNFPKWWDQK
jgi:hypothetical protein